MEETMMALKRVVTRKKISTCPGDGGQATERCLTIVDVTCLGLSTIVGNGMFTLLSYSAKDHAGPSVVLSFLVASVASCLGGLCYSELATRFPRGGSAYAYVYSTTGELCAFIVAWCTLLDYCLGCALAAKAWSSYVDSLFNGTIRHTFGCPKVNHHNSVSLESVVVPRSHGSLPGMEQCPDVLALLPLVLVAVSLSSRTKLSCVINNVLVIVAVLSITTVVMVGVFNMDTQNWLGGVGFFPNGVAGVFCGSSACFLAFLGYDAIATSTPEMVHRSRILPTSVSLTFIVGLLSSFSCACVVTLLLPSALLDPLRGPLMKAFEIRKIHGMSLVVVLGATTGLTASVIACLYGLSRLLLALSNDGLIFGFLGTRNRGSISGHEQLDDPGGAMRVTDRRQGMCNPLYAMNSDWAATAFGATVTSFIALFVDGHFILSLIGMGTLIAFLSAAVSVLCLRYGVVERLPLECGELSRESTATLVSPLSSRYAELYENAEYPSTPSDAEENCSCEATSPDSRIRNDGEVGTVSCRAPTHHASRGYGSCGRKRGRTVAVEYVNDGYVSSLPLDPFAQMTKHEPTTKSATTTAMLVGSVVALMLITGLLTVQVPRLTVDSNNWNSYSSARWWTEAIACLLFLILVACMVMVARQPRHKFENRNAVPCVPLLPVCAIWMDVHLIICLPYAAWLGTLIWTVIGMVLYISYSVWHSTERSFDDIQDVALSSVNEDLAERHTQTEALVESC